MQIRRRPFVGVVLNFIWFGLADIYVGHFRRSIPKLLLHVFVGLTWGAMHAHTRSLFESLTVELIGLAWIIFTLVDGYRTVRQSVEGNHEGGIS